MELCLLAGRLHCIRQAAAGELLCPPIRWLPQIKLMTSWAVVCDVYFLEPQVTMLTVRCAQSCSTRLGCIDVTWLVQTQAPGESSQQFAERVQVRKGPQPALALPGGNAQPPHAVLQALIAARAHLKVVPWGTSCTLHSPLA